jgi:hypothetical protein
MIGFPFRVNPSFRTYPTHPITIPRGLVSYRELDDAASECLTIDVAYPNGGIVPARISRGQAGFGEYRQIRGLKAAGWPSVIAKEGEWVDIEIVCEKRIRIYVRAR